MMPQKQGYFKDRKHLGGYMKRIVLLAALVIAATGHVAAQALQAGYQYQYFPLNLDLFDPYDNKTYAATQTAQEVAALNMNFPIISHAEYNHEYSGKTGKIHHWRLVKEATYLVLGFQVGMNITDFTELGDNFSASIGAAPFGNLGLYALGQFPIALGPITIAPQAGFQWAPLGPFKYWLKGGLALFASATVEAFKPYLHFNVEYPLFTDEVQPPGIPVVVKHGAYTYSLVSSISKETIPLSFSIMVGLRFMLVSSGSNECTTSSGAAGYKTNERYKDSGDYQYLCVED
jgi:hypothetical protein